MHKLRSVVALRGSRVAYRPTVMPVENTLYAREASS